MQRDTVLTHCLLTDIVIHVPFQYKEIKLDVYILWPELFKIGLFNLWNIYSKKVETHHENTISGK